MTVDGADATRPTGRVPTVSRSSQLYEVIDRWQRVPRFRADLRSDPESTVRRLGIELSDAEWAGLRDLVSGT